MSGFPNTYGDGMYAFEQGPRRFEASDSVGLEYALPSPDKFAAVDAALTSLGIDIAQALTDPKIAALTSNLFAIGVDALNLNSVNDKPKPE